MELYRDPCPYRILSDAGGAFSMGGIGGVIREIYRGSKSTPIWSRKAKACIKHIHRDASKLGGSFAMWGTTFSAIDCSLAALRQKEDPINSIIAGGATGGLLAVRSGPAAIAGQAFVGAVLLGIIEGFGILMGRFSSPVITEEPMPDTEQKSFGLQ